MATSIPQFGNWDQNNMPMTQCFENVRKKKGAARPPPEENPSHVQVSPTTRQGQPQKNGSPYEEYEKPNSVDWGEMDKGSINGSRGPGYNQSQSKREKGGADTGLPPWTPQRARFAPTVQNNEHHPTVPKFGDWEANPNMTLVFDNVRGKKQGIEGAGLAPVPRTPTHHKVSPEKNAKKTKSPFSRWLKSMKEAIFGK